MGVTADISKAEDISSAIGELVKRFGTIHVLVNNAAGVQGFASVNDLTGDDWLAQQHSSMLAVQNLNLVGVVALAMHVRVSIVRQFTPMVSSKFTNFFPGSSPLGFVNSAIYKVAKSASYELEISGVGAQELKNLHGSSIQPPKDKSHAFCDR